MAKMAGSIWKYIERERERERLQIVPHEDEPKHHFSTKNPWLMYEYKWHWQAFFTYINNLITTRITLYNWCTDLTFRIASEIRLRIWTNLVVVLWDASMLLPVKTRHQFIKIHEMLRPNFDKNWLFKMETFSWKCYSTQSMNVLFL